MITEVTQGRDDDSATATATVLVSWCGDRAEITINRPPANALDDRTLDDLRLALAGLGRGRLGGLLLTGGGDRFFSAGGDIKELENIGHGRGTGRVDRFNAAMAELSSLEVPVAIAANGIAVGGGTELLLNCDRAVGVRGARFGLPEINHGLLPSAASIGLAVRRLGFVPAREMLLSGEIFDAERALEIGLVQELVDSAEDARESARAWLDAMAAKPPVLVAAMKRALERAPSLDHDGQVELTREQFTAYFEDPGAIAARQAVLGRWSS